MNTDLLVKLMRMTTSSHDGEVLAAIRRANAMLAAEKKDWGDVLGARVVRTYEPPPRPRPPPSRNPYAAEWERASRQYTTGKENFVVSVMLDALLNGLVVSSTGFYSFLESVKKQYDERGSFTRKQADVIRKAYERSQQRG